MEILEIKVANMAWIWHYRRPSIPNYFLVHQIKYTQIRTIGWVNISSYSLIFLR